MLQHEIMSTIYIHWPFCLSKCGYCSFNSCPQSGYSVDYSHWLFLYKSILLKFVDLCDDKEINSVYFGGGTPSLLPPFFVHDLIKFIDRNFLLAKNAEITIEANPEAICIQKASDFKMAGINRISIGLQSINDSTLKILNRQSSAQSAIDCIYEMSKIFSNVSIDLIYNIPHQSIEQWSAELQEIIKMFKDCINHMSCYELIVEEGTKIYDKIINKALPMPEQHSGDFFDVTHSTLGDNAFEAYEVSNFAKDNRYCHHNLSYWQYNQSYFGIGPGAHSRIFDKQSVFAVWQEANINKWLCDPLCFGKEELSTVDIIKERLLMNLRSTKCGIPRSMADEKKIENLKKSSYINDGEDELITLTLEGLKRLNLIIDYVLDS